MKHLMLYMAFIIFSYSAKAISFETLFALNSEWTTEKYNSCKQKKLLNPNSENELIRTHLQLVEQNLRKTNISHLTKKQLANRSAALNILHTYWNNSIFPINTFHTERTPYFIDYKGTACAVGQLIIETGFKKVAEKINRENNYGYIHDLVKEYPEIKNWATEFGFTVDELAWIQPTYSVPPTFGTDSVIVLNLPTCPGYANGQIILPDSTSSFYPSNLTPPFSATIFPAGLTFCYCLQGNINYQITISDANNTSWSFTQFLPDPPPVTIGLAISQPIICSGDTAIIHVSGTGGFGAYTGTGLFPRIAGTHTFTIADSNGCQKTDSISLINPLPLTSNAVVSQPILCNGDSATIQIGATGGVGTFTGTGTFQIPAGNNFYTVADSNNCQITDSINVVEPAPIVSIYTVTQPILCNGDSGTVLVTATGGTGPITGTGSYNTIAGTYSILVADSNGCQKSTNITMIEPPALQLSFGAVPDNGTGNGSVKATVNGGIQPYTFNWSNAQTTDSIFNLTNGNYTLTVTDFNGCVVSGGANVLLEFPLAIKSNGSDVMKIYPNPTVDKKCTIEFSNNAKREITVLNIIGETVQTVVTSDEKLQLNFLDSGIYILKIMEAGKFYTKKIVVN